MPAQTASPERLIYLAACKMRDPELRREYLDDACGADLALRHRLDSLLDLELKHGADPLHQALRELGHSPVDNTPDNDAGRREGRPTVRQIDETVDARINISQHPVIGRYKLLEELGSGGMGAVYMAQQTAPVKRKVALKIIKPGMDSREVIARFQAERQALAMMDHTNIARVLDAGTTDEGRPYFVMELVRGIPITKFCEQKKLNLQDRLKLFIDVCKAVQHAHQKAIIHRDLKPSNILVTLHDGEPVVKVIDFGVAKALNQELTEHTLFTQFSQMIGTPLYISPEQAEMSGLDVDTRSDIYALGVVLYELLTGTTPIERESLAKLGYDAVRKLVVEQEPPRPSARISTLRAMVDSTVSAPRCSDSKVRYNRLSVELDWIVMKAIDMDRTRRYQSAVDFSDDVQRFLTGEEVHACPPTVLYRVRKYSKRHFVGLMSASVLLIVLLIGIATTSYQAYQAQLAKADAVQQREIADEAKRQELDARKLAESRYESENKLRIAEANAKERATDRAREADAAKKQALYNLYVSDMRLGKVDIKSGHWRRAGTALRRHKPGPAKQDYRGWEWYYLLSQVHEENHSLYDVDGVVSCVEFSADGRYLAAVSMLSNQLVIWDSNALHNNPRVLPLPGRAWRVRWSPTGSKLAISFPDGNKQVLLIDTDSWGGQVLESKELTSGINVLQWSPDGRLLAANEYGRDETLVVWDVDSAEPQTLPTLGQGIYGLAWSPTEHRLALSSRYEAALILQDPTSGAEMARNENLAIGRLQSVDWLRSGESIAVGGSEGSVAILDAHNFVVDYTIRVTDKSVKAKFSPNGELLAAVAQDGSAFIYELESRDLIATFNTKHGSRNAVHWLPSFSWSPDSKYLATGGDDHVVRIWAINRLGSEVRVSANQRAPLNLGIQWLNKGEQFSISGTEAAKHEHPNVPRNPQFRLFDVSGNANQELDSTDYVSGETIFAAALNSDQSLLVVASKTDQENPEIRFRIVDVFTGAAIQTFNTPGCRTHVPRIGFSQNGERLFAWHRCPGKRAIIAWESLTGRLLVDSSRDKGLEQLRYAECVEWDRNGKLLALGLGTPVDGLLVLDTDAPQIAWRTKHSSTNCTAVKWSSDGSQVAFGSSDGALTICQAADGKVLVEEASHSAGIVSLDWSPDDRRIVTVSNDGRVKMLDAANGVELLDLTKKEQDAQLVSWSPSGEHLIISNSDGSARILDASDGYRFADSSNYVEWQASDLLIDAQRHERHNLTKATQLFLNAIDSGTVVSKAYLHAANGLLQRGDFDHCLNILLSANDNRNNGWREWMCIASAYTGLSEQRSAADAYTKVIDRFSGSTLFPSEYLVALLERAQCSTANSFGDLDRFFQVVRDHWSGKLSVQQGHAIWSATRSLCGHETLSDIVDRLEQMPSEHACYSIAALLPLMSQETKRTTKESLLAISSKLATETKRGMPIAQFLAQLNLILLRENTENHEAMSPSPQLASDTLRELTASCNAYEVATLCNLFANLYPAFHREATMRQLVRSVNAHLSEKPNTPGLQKALGELYFRLRIYRKARSALEAADSLMPRDIETTAYLGLTALALGDSNKAGELQQRCRLLRLRTLFHPTEFPLQPVWGLLGELNGPEVLTSDPRK